MYRNSIGLIDVDSHNFPNLALMKISAYHKSKGDSVEWWNGLMYYDRVYKSRVFDDTYTKEMDYCINAEEIIQGGTGYDLQNELLYEIEHIMPDYSLYGVDEAYGFLTRGCPRHCNFCIVGDKEGLKSEKVADLSEFWDGQKSIKLLDPNITASKDCESLFQGLIDSNAWIDFTQGLDIRCLTDKGASQLNQMKLKILHFAWDNYEFKTYEKLKTFRPYLDYDYRKLKVYVLTNFATTHEQDLERICKLRELNYDPYVMVFNKPNAPRKTRLLQRYVNNKIIFRTVETFEEYNSNLA